MRAITQLINYELADWSARCGRDGDFPVATLRGTMLRRPNWPPLPRLRPATHPAMTLHPVRTGGSVPRRAGRADADPIWREESVDLPSPVAELLDWFRATGFEAEATHTGGDIAILTATCV